MGSCCNREDKSLRESCADDDDDGRNLLDVSSSEESDSIDDPLEIPEDEEEE